ncbi:MAG: porin family protein [Chitinophagaceae bacterium]
MKKIIIFAVLAIATQSSFAQFIKIGPKGGVNLSKVTGQSFKDEFNLGYYAGGFIELSLGNKWYLQPEVLFNENSVRRTNDFASLYNNLLKTDSLKNIKLQYISIPMVIGYKIANVLSIEGGAQYGIKMNQHETLLQNGKEAFKNGDLSLLAGVEFRLSKFRITARYAVGINSINDIDNRDKWKSQTVQAGIGFVF